MIIYPKLKFPPLQYIAKQKLPEILIYQKQYKLYESADIMVDEFIAFSLKKPSEYAKMKCIKSETARENNIKVPSVYVWFLRSNDSGHGLGSTLLHIAKNYREGFKCLGNRTLNRRDIKSKGKTSESQDYFSYAKRLSNCYEYL